MYQDLEKRVMDELSYDVSYRRIRFGGKNLSYKMFLGTAIDKEFKFLIREDNTFTNVYSITKQGLKEPDLKYIGSMVEGDANKYWVDTTTEKAVNRHFN